MGHITTDNYDTANDQNSKEPVIVLEIEGLPFIFSSAKVFTTLRYDDPGVYYDGTYIYDGLRPLDSETQKNLIDRAGSFSTISQKLEQWDGKASVETCNIKLVDKNGLVTQVCTPGVYLDEILNKKIRVFYGFQSISYPEDYLLLFKGYMNNLKMGQGNVSFVFTDPSSKRKQVLFNATTSKLTVPALTAATTLTVTSTDNFYRTITNPVGDSDPGVTIGLVLDGKEIVTFTNADIISGTQVNVVRGQFGTQAVDHDADIEVKMFIHFEDNPLSIALKTQLSGWNGPWIEDIALRGIINNDSGGTTANSITVEQGKDVERDYGLSLGDFVTISNSIVVGNNGIYTVSDIVNGGRTIVFKETTLTQEDPPTNGNLAATAAFRSKYDVYPVTAGLGLTTDDVYVSRWEDVRNTFVPFEFKMSVPDQEASGKTWIETHLLKPIGAYSLTQGARISVGITHPPLANDLTKFIDPTNVIQAKGIEVERGLNNRFFYNEILFKYKYDSIQDEFFRTFRFVDADAQDRMQQVSVLELEMRGLDDSQNSIDIMTARAKRILQRYKFASETISLSVNFGTGHTIDAGDIVVLDDTTPPTLQIANTETGERGIYTRIMEVQERSINISQGMTKLSLLSNNGFSFSDRYAVVGPSSLMDDSFAHTTTLLKIKDSFSIKFPGAEYKKWQDYQGSVIRVHNADFSLDANTVFTLDASDPFVFHLTPALPFTPIPGMIVQFAKYDDTSASINQLVKATFAHRDPSAPIFSAASESTFVLDSGYSNRYIPGMIVYVKKLDGSFKSPDVKIVSVIGDVVTIGGIFAQSINSDLGFIPTAGDTMELAGFKDKGSGYRLI